MASLPSPSSRLPGVPTQTRLGLGSLSYGVSKMARELDDMTRWVVRLSNASFLGPDLRWTSLNLSHLAQNCDTKSCLRERRSEVPYAGST
jgi:hypothetical protein